MHGWVVIVTHKEQCEFVAIGEKNTDYYFFIYSLTRAEEQ